MRTRGVAWPHAILPEHVAGLRALFFSSASSRGITFCFATNPCPSAFSSSPKFPEAPIFLRVARGNIEPPNPLQRCCFSICPQFSAARINALTIAFGSDVQLYAVPWPSAASALRPVGSRGRTRSTTAVRCAARLRVTRRSDCCKNFSCNKRGRHEHHECDHQTIHRNSTHRHPPSPSAMPPRYTIHAAPYANASMYANCKPAHTQPIFPPPASRTVTAMVLMHMRANT